MKFVIVITINQEAQNAPTGPDLAHIFRWDLRHLIGNGDDPIENAGPSVATGTADTVDHAKTTAQAYASYYALEQAYIYEV